MQLACRLLSVAESGYYEWRSRPPSARALRHTWLTDQIRAVRTASRGTYGARRVHAELTLGLGLRVGHGQVEMLMNRAAIKGLPGTRRPKPRHETPTAVDLVERMFTLKRRITVGAEFGCGETIELIGLGVAAGSQIHRQVVFGYRSRISLTHDRRRVVGFQCAHRCVELMDAVAVHTADFQRLDGPSV